MSEELGTALEVTLAGDGVWLTLRVSAYAFPEVHYGPDADWLDGEVELIYGHMSDFRAHQQLTLHTEELQSFAGALRDTLAHEAGTANLSHSETRMGASIELTPDGALLSAFVSESGGAELRFHGRPIDRPALTRALRELEAIAQTFPSRGVAS
jgi:hypothetical protein